MWPALSPSAGPDELVRHALLVNADVEAAYWEWRAALVERLNRLRLTLHARQAVPYPVPEGIPFLGFVVFPTHRRLKRRKGMAYQRKLGQLVQAGDNDRLRASLQGWLNHARYGDTYGLRQAILARAGLLSQEVKHDR